MSKPNFEAILTAFGNQIQDLEDALYSLLRDRFLDFASGVQLDGLGEILGESRQGRSDAEYQEALKVRILINLCEGTTEEILEIFSRLLPSISLELTEYPPAAFTLFIMGMITTDDAIRLKNFLELSRPAAVASTLFYTVVPISEIKRFDTPGQGFDSGKFIGAL